ncbi:ribonuclease Z [Spirochaeta cellobiosiphila]|uniref:ribonuclease Z n=1 Tax=Spirochaeta cellobiosiphila TaxID=504483 RepID=UPI00040C45DD|nr:ribonuclease Z [Spirochaeta cellobiosiphila]
MSLEVFVLGTSGMMPLPGRFLTSALVRREGDLFLFDAGEGTQVSLKMLNLKWKKISAIFISHIHADHVTGLPGILMLSSQVDRTEPLYIFGPAKVGEYIEMSRSVLEMYINYEIIFKAIDNFQTSEILIENDEYLIRSVPLKHTKPCLGYVIEEKERPGVFHPEKAKEFNVPVGPLWSKLQKGESVTNLDGENILPSQVLGEPRKGCKFSYITDTQYIESISPEISGSDLVICESMFMDALADSAKEKKHLTSKQAARIALEAGNVGQLGLIHYSPRYTDWELKRLLKEAQSVFPNTFLTKDRQVIMLNNQD